MKETPEGLKPKVCLVACGFCYTDTLQTVLAVTAQNESYQRSVDGLSDASLKCYTQVTKFAIENIDVISKIDPSLSLWYKGNKIRIH